MGDLKDKFEGSTSLGQLTPWRYDPEDKKENVIDFVKKLCEYKADEIQDLVNGKYGPMKHGLLDTSVESAYFVDNDTNDDFYPYYYDDDDVDYDTEDDYNEDTNDDSVEAEKNANELVAEEERIKNKAEKKRLKKKRQKDRKRQEKLEEELKDNKENKMEKYSINECSRKEEKENKNNVAGSVTGASEKESRGAKERNQCNNIGETADKSDEDDETEDELDLCSTFVSQVRRKVDKKPKVEKKDRAAKLEGKEPVKKVVENIPETNLLDRSMTLAGLGNEMAKFQYYKEAVTLFTQAIILNPREYRYVLGFGTELFLPLGGVQHLFQKDINSATPGLRVGLEHLVYGILQGLTERLLTSRGSHVLCLAVRLAASLINKVLQVCHLIFAYALRSGLQLRLFGNRSYCYERMLQYKEALNDAEVALSLMPYWPKGYFRKGKALMGLKRYDEAKCTFEAVLKADKTHVDAACELQRCQMQILLERRCVRENEHKPQVPELFPRILIPQPPQPLLPAVKIENMTKMAPGFPCSRDLKMHDANGSAMSLSYKNKIPTPSEVRGNVKEEAGSKLKAEPLKLRQLYPIWVGNVTSRIAEKNLKSLFEQFGHIHSIRILYDRTCAFINFSDKEAAERAFYTLQGIHVEGTTFLLQLRNPEHANITLGAARTNLAQKPLPK